MGSLSPKWSFFPILDNVCVPVQASASIQGKNLYLFSRFSDEGMEVIERLIYLYHKFHQLKVSNEEYACMKAINFLNQDIRGLTSASQLEQLNKRYWYICQDFTEYKYTHQPNRFPDLMMCLPEIRYIAGKMVNVPLEQLPLLFKVVLHSCKTSTVKE